MLELTFNHDGRTYDLGTGYGHIAIGVDDLDGTLDALKGQGIEPERPPYTRERGRLAPLLRPRPGRLPDRAHRARLSPMSGCLSPKRAQIVFWQKTLVSIAYGAKLA